MSNSSDIDILKIETNFIDRQTENRETNYRGPSNRCTDGMPGKGANKIGKGGTIV